MNLLTDVKDFFFPRTCIGCGKRLGKYEQDLCISCLLDLPYTRLLKSTGNAMERLFWGHFPIERASALFYYAKMSTVAHILHDMKYHGQRRLCIRMGEMMGHELLPSGFFDDIDHLIPVPLHPARLRNRGYNQCELLAEGISRVTDLPVVKDAIYRLRNNTTQTSKTVRERIENVASLFALHPEQIPSLKNRHVLLIDDVMTTGATLTACAHALCRIEGIRISIATLAWSKH